MQGAGAVAPSNWEPISNVPVSGKLRTSSGFLAAVELAPPCPWQRALAGIFGIWAPTAGARSVVAGTNFTFYSLAAIPAVLGHIAASLGVAGASCGIFEGVVATRDLGKAALARRKAALAIEKCAEGYSLFHVKSSRERSAELTQSKADVGKMQKEVADAENGSSAKLANARQGLINAERAHQALLALHFDEYIRFQEGVSHIKVADQKAKSAGIAFARDGLAQCSNAGCTVASALVHFGVEVSVNITLNGIFGSVFGILGGATHVAAGVYALHSEETNLSVAKTARGKSSDLDAMAASNRAAMTQLLKDCKPDKTDKADITTKADKYDKVIASAESDEIDKITTLVAALQKHFFANQDSAVTKALYGMGVAKRRIAYGSVATLLGIGGLVTVVTIGAISTGGLLVAGLAIAAGFVWLSYGLKRMLISAGEASDAYEADQAAMERAKALHGSEDWQAIAAALPNNKFLALSELTARMTNGNPASRKLLKAALMKLGIDKRMISTLKMFQRFGAPQENTNRIFRYLQNYLLDDGARGKAMFLEGANASVLIHSKPIADIPADVSHKTGG